MGVLPPGSAHASPSAGPPIGTSGNFPARVSAEWPSNISKGKKEYNRPVPGGYIPWLLAPTFVPAVTGSARTPLGPKTGQVFFFSGNF